MSGKRLLRAAGIAIMMSGCSPFLDYLRADMKKRASASPAQMGSPSIMCAEYKLTRPPGDSTFMAMLGPAGSCSTNGPALRDKCLVLCAGLFHDELSSPAKARAQEDAIAQVIVHAVATLRQQEQLLARAVRSKLQLQEEAEAGPNQFSGDAAVRCRRYLDEVKLAAPEFAASLGSGSRCWTGDYEISRQCDVLCRNMWTTQEQIVAAIASPSAN